MSIKNRSQYGWLLVVSYSLMGMFFPAAVTQFSMVIGELATEMEVSQKVIMLSDTVRAICLVTSMLLAQTAYKKLGLRATIFLGIAFQTVSQFFIPLAVTWQSVPLLFILKGLQGMNAVAFPLFISTISGWIDPNQRGLATSIFNGSFNAGAGIGAWISGQIIPLLGWKASFILIATVTVISAIPTILFTKDPQTTEPTQETTTQKPSYGAIMGYPALWVMIFSLLAYTWVSQAVIVDMSIYSNALSYDYASTGSLMLYISLATVIFSIAGGFVSDFFAKRATNRLSSRCHVLAIGYVVSIGAAIVLPLVAAHNFPAFVICGVALMAGVAWAQGVFWAIPPEIFSNRYLVGATALCSGISNIVNPLAPVIVGVVLGANGLWHLAWLSCCFICVFSLFTTILLPKMDTTRYINGN